MSNIQKLFYERIEEFGAVEFSKLSIVTGIVKIALEVLTTVMPPQVYLQIVGVNLHLLYSILTKCAQSNTLNQCL